MACSTLLLRSARSISSSSSALSSTGKPFFWHPVCIHLDFPVCELNKKWRHDWVGIPPSAKRRCSYAKGRAREGENGR